jgi:hypothetical protein
MHYNSIFQQLFNFIPRHRFEKATKKYSGDHYCKHFTALKQVLTCLYAQITGKDSLRRTDKCGMHVKPPVKGGITALHC